MWRLDHVPFFDHTRVLLQYARIWLLYTPVCHSHSRYTHGSYSEVLHGPRVVHPDYLGCERLRTVSKDKLSSLFFETPSSWGDRQNTLCSAFAKGSKILNMVMTLSHYNTITEPYAWFLLSLIEDLSIDFPSHFILSLVNVYKDTATRDKLIFPSAIMWLLCQFFVSYPKSPHFTLMCAIDTATVKWSIAQRHLRQPWTETAAPPASTSSSTSAIFSGWSDT